MLFLLVFTPLAFGTVEPWSEAIAELVVLGMVVAWLLGMALRDWELRIELPPGWLAGSLFLALIFLQAVSIPMALAHAISPWTTGFYDQVRMYTGAGPSSVPLSLAAHDTWREALKIGAVAAFFLVCYNVYRTRAQVHRALWTMIAVGAAISVLGIVQRVTWNGRFYWVGPEGPHRNAFGPFVNRAHFAGLMVVVVPMALALWLASRYTPTRKQLVRTLRDRLRSWNTSDGGPTTLIPFLVLLMGGAALVSGTRGGLVALMVTLLAMIVAGMRERTGAAARIAAYGALVVLAGLWIGSDVVQGTLGRLVEELEQGTESSRSPSGAIRSPCGGMPGSGRRVATRTVFRASARSRRTSSSRMPRRLGPALTDTGLGSLAVLATLGVIVVSCLRLRTRTRLDILAIGAAVAALGAASQGVGNFSFVVMSNLLYVAAAVGVVCPYLRGKAADHA